MIREMEHLSYEERLRQLRLLILETLGRSYGSLPVPKNVYKRVGKRLFTRTHSDRMIGMGFKTENQ